MTVIRRFYTAACEFAERRWVVWALVVANFIGFVAGIIYWYGDHLARAPRLLWPFIPDCPLFALLFIPAYGLALRGRGNNAYNVLVAFGLIKYGVWTNLAWYAYWGRGYPVSVEGVIMCITHLGMIAQGLYLLRYLRPRLGWAILAFLWFAASDFVDYGLGEYPRVPDLATLPLLQWHTIAMTFGLTALFVGWSRRVRGAPAPVAMAGTSTSSPVEAAR